MISTPPANIAVLGVGLLGGSLLAALRKNSPGLHLRAWARRKETVEEITKLNLADVASTDIELVTQGAELIILCTPVETMLELAENLNPATLAPSCVVTDVGSVKATVVTTLEDILGAKKIDYLGSHPMAGSEKSGLANARPDLFEGATCITTPTLFTTQNALHQVRWLWSHLGCRVLEMSAEEHDRRIARISHMPHLAAVAVAISALHEDHDAARCLGGGVRDSTRIASGDPGLWTGIISQNRAQALSALGELQDVLSRLIQAVQQSDDKALHSMLDQAKLLRDQAVQS